MFFLDLSKEWSVRASLFPTIVGVIVTPVYCLLANFRCRNHANIRYSQLHEAFNDNLLVRRSLTA